MNVEITKKEIVRWTIIVGLLKIFWFSFFIVFRNPEWPQHEVIKGIALASGDYEQYYRPMETFVAGEGYSSACRMPGLLPIYLPLRLVLDAETAQVTMTILQVLADILATILLAIVASRILQDRRAFAWTALMYGISTFVSIRSNYLLSDSFSISTMIISVYFLSTAILLEKKKFLWLAGIFIIWSVFMRPVGLILYGCAGLVLLFHLKGNIVRTFFWMVPVVVPGLMAIFFWTLRNNNVYGKPIYLQAPMEECYSLYTYEQQAIVGLLLTMGEDFQKWSPGSGSEWFFAVKTDDPKHPFKANDFCSAYTIDSLVVLRQNYRDFLAAEDDTLKQTLSKQIFEKSERYSTTYKSERPFNYYLINRLNYIRLFMFPNRLDDLPLPASSDMNILQKASKAGSFLLLLIVNALALLSAVYFLIRKNFMLLAWSSFGFAFIFILGFIGFIEQRYLTPSFPLMCVMAVALLIQLSQKIRPSAIA